MLLFATAIAILGAARWTLAIKENREKKEVVGGLPSPYLQTLLWSLPVEIAAAALSGRDYPHYLLPLFPTLAVLAAWFLAELQSQMKAIPARPALVTTLLLGLCPFALLAYAGDFSRSTEPPRSEFLAVAQFIQHATTPKDKITVVETESGYITFLAQRLPASRFVYQLPLIDAEQPGRGRTTQAIYVRPCKEPPGGNCFVALIVGVLCATPLDCPAQDPQTPAAEYGYQYQILPKLFSMSLHPTISRLGSQIRSDRCWSGKTSRSLRGGDGYPSRLIVVVVRRLNVRHIISGGNAGRR